MLILVDRYIAVVDRNGVISTGHAALESPEGIYISLHLAVEIDRSPDDFTRLLRATRENDVPGVFQPDYPTESKAWCPSTVQVRIRNYDPLRLRRFWEVYRQDTTYNLTRRNCWSTVSRALEAALEGASAPVWGGVRGWRPFLRVIATPELWVAAQLRKRAATLAWTPGLTLDYARAQHADRPAAIRLGQDGAPRGAPDDAVAAAMARRGAPCIGGAGRAARCRRARCAIERQRRAQLRHRGENDNRVNGLRILAGSYAQICAQFLLITSVRRTTVE